MSDDLESPTSREAVPLASLRPGERAVVAAVEAGNPVAGRLMDLGFLPGTPLRVVRRAPLGDPVAYEIRGTRICLRVREAEEIQVHRGEAELES